MLTPLQVRLAGIVTALPEARGFALAGAGGLLVHGLIDRETRDLDYFTAPGQDTAVTDLRDALENALDIAGLSHRRQRDLPSFVRIEVGDGQDRCEVDLAVDYRALEVETSTYGPTLAIEELAANKVLALFDRAEARDFLVVVALTRRFELRALLALAAEKDPGVDREGFRDALGSFDRFTSADFGVSHSEYEHVGAAVARWRVDLAGEQVREPPEIGV